MRILIRMANPIKVMPGLFCFEFLFEMLAKHYLPNIEGEQRRVSNNDIIHFDLSSKIAGALTSKKFKKKKNF
jgi:hypothetical protein